MSHLFKKILSISASLLLALGSIAGFVSEPASATYANDWNAAGLHEMARYMGQYQASTDGFGHASGSGSLDILKPTGATNVVAAFLTTGGRDHFGVVSTEPTVTLGSTSITSYSARARIAGVSNPFQGDFTNYFADVTSVVQNFFASSPTGTAETTPWAGSRYSIPVTYQPNNSSNLDDPAGVSLTVIFSNPSMSYDASVVVYFGTSNSSGQDFQLDFQQLPNAQTNSWLSFGIAWSAGGGQYSNIKARNNLSSANTWTYLSGSAGGFNDGDGGSNLLTVGGVGDSTANPANAQPNDGQSDDELYNIDSLLSTGVNQVTLNMTNPSGDDNIFGAVLSVPFILSGSGSVQTHTVTYDTQGGSAGTVANYLNSINVFPANPTKLGFVFDGWYDSNALTTQAITPYTPATFSDITLYAKWSSATHAVTYDSHGGTAVNGSTYSGTITSLASDSVRSGYTFNGWFESSSGGTRIQAPFTPTVFADITLHAQWTLIPVQQVPTTAPSPTPTQTPTATPEPPAVVTPAAKPRKIATLVVAGFADGSPILASITKAKIAKFVNAHKSYKKATCTGYTEGPTVLRTDASLSKQRGKNACDLVASLTKKKVAITSISAVQSRVESPLNRRVKIVMISH